MATKDTQPKAAGYEPPVLRVIGSAHDLTQGPIPGDQPDLVQFHASA
jgi:hypothetical protein